jgi:hypothetical protein
MQSGLQAGSIYNQDTLDKGMIYVLAGTEQDSARFHGTTQNGT